jgi:hypothetical protein
MTARRWDHDRLKQLPETAVAQAQPVVLGPRAQQDLSHGQAHQFRVGQLLRPSGPAPVGRDDVIVDQHIQCDQKGIKVCLHTPTSIPFPSTRSSCHADQPHSESLI